MGIIYKITNKVNNKIYIGQTIYSLTHRWNQHRNQRSDILMKDRKLYRAFNKYGIQNFSIEQIEECDNSLLNEREVYWIKYYDSFNNGYNMTLGGDGKTLITPEFRQKIIELYSSGICIRDITHIVHSTIETISYYLKLDLHLTDEQIKKNGYQLRNKKQNNPVVQLDLNNNYINQFESQKQAQEQTGVLYNHIGQVCKGQRKTAGGYKWKFLKDYEEA